MDQVDAAIQRVEHAEQLEARQFGPVKIGMPGQDGVSGRTGVATLGLPPDATEAEVAEFMAWLSLQAIQTYRQVRATRSAGRLALPNGATRVVAKPS